MIAVQNQQNKPQSFSAAAAVAPIVLWSGRTQGNVYVAATKTFLEFYTDEKKAIKRCAAARSASCDSCLKDIERTSTVAPSSPSPSHRSLASSDGNVTTKLRSPVPTPRNTTHDINYTNGFFNYYNNDCYNMSYQCYDDGSYQCYDGSSQCYQGAPTGTGYPMNQAMMMAPDTMSMSYVQDQQEVLSKLMKSHLPCKKVDLKEASSEPVMEITTLMIRGIPCSFSQDTLMKLIDHAGLKGKYDFFYLPRAGNHGSNLGYAFVNFTDAFCAEHFAATFNGVPLDPSRSMKVCSVSPGDIQGLSNLRKHFRRTAVSRGSRGPVFLKVFSEEEDEL